MSSVHPDLAYPPPGAPDYTNPMGPPPAYPGTANPMSMVAGYGGFSSGNHESFQWGQFSTSGLDLLNSQDKVTVTKLFNPEEAATYIDKPRRFAVTTDGTTQLMSMIEDEEHMRTHVHHRAFEINAMDPTGARVFTIVRETTSMCTYCCFCCACFGDGCKVIIKVKINDRTIGTIKQNCTFASPSFTVYHDDDDREWFHIDGGNACCQPTTDFSLRDAKSPDPYGIIKKSGFRFGMFSNTYTANFPSQSTAETKMMCLAAIVMLDFRFFNPMRPRQGRRH